MALLDGELPDDGRLRIEEHLHACPSCRAEYLGYRKLFKLSHQLLPAIRCEQEFNGYWDGVCRKMEKRGHWSNWKVVAVALALVGLLMIFGFHGALLPSLLGGVTLLVSVCLLWLSHFCNCRRPPRDA